MAGELITQNWQMEVNGYLIGAGTIWGNDTPGWTGIFGKPVKPQDTELGGAHGGVAATDYNATKLVTAAVTTAHQPRTVAECVAAMADIEDAFAASEVDVQLHFQLDGLGHVYLIGRTRGAVVDMEHLAVGECYALCTFKVLDLTRYPYPEPS